MKKLLILTLLVFLGIVKKGQAQSDTVLANADSTITIIGKVVDKETNEEIPFANIVFYSGEKQLRYIQSDFDGTFRAEIDTTGIISTLSLEISYTGYSRF